MKCGDLVHRLQVGQHSIRGFVFELPPHAVPIDVAAVGNLPSDPHQA